MAIMDFFKSKTTKKEEAFQYYLESGEGFNVDEPLAQGGEGEVYLLKNNYVFKRYFPDKLTKEKEEKIKYMINNNSFIPNVCWPEKAVYDGNGKFSGYIMIQAKGLEMQKSIFVKPLLEKSFPHWKRIDLIKLCRNILDTIKIFHDRNVIIGDINPRNIMVTKDAEVFWVDTDSYQLGCYKCPVGTVNFTAPEIQGKNYSQFYRTKEHEYFAIATLLFMIMLPGKQPYAYQGGGNPGENIKNMNFSYPFDDDANWKAPKGPWEFIWNELPFEVKEAFYGVFKENKRLSTEQWITVFNKYEKEYEEGRCSTEIFPKVMKRNMEDISLSMNRRNQAIGEMETTLWFSDKVEKNIAVLELSTKAVKLLIGNTEILKNDGFSFRAFYRNGILTNTGDGLNSKNEMNLEFFRQQVLPRIKKQRSDMRYRKVDVCYAVATAAYRTAQNNKEILDLIKKETGLNVRILSKEEEAKATLSAFMFSKGDLNINSNEMLLIDQGGGSTEIALFKNGEVLHTYSLDLGTTALKNRLFVNSNNDTDMKFAIKQTEKAIRSKMAYYYKNHLPDIHAPICISVGTVITSATGKKGNKKQHGTIMDLEEITSKMLEIEKDLCDRFTTVGEALISLEEDTKEITLGNIRESETEKLIILRLGLFLYKDFMEKTGINEVLVSGTGLWYGIYHDKFKEIYS